MARVRKAGWFAMLAMILAVWVGVLGTVRGVAQAGVIGSIVPEETANAEDLAALQKFLENKVVAQKLIDYGVSPEEAMTKARGMNPRELHQLAALTDRAPEGTSAAGFLIALAALAIIIFVVIKMLELEVIIR